MTDNDKGKNSGWSITITVALIGLLGTLGAALIGKLDTILPNNSAVTSPSPSQESASNSGGSDQSGSDQLDTSWLSNIVGRYGSAIAFTGGVVPGMEQPGVTEFWLNPPDTLTGYYEIGQPAMVSGTLSQCEILEVRKIRCRWNDRRGVGSLEISFSEGFNSFDGYWNFEGSTETWSWRSANPIAR